MARTLQSAALTLLCAASLSAQHLAQVKPAADYSSKQSQTGVTIAVKAYHTPELVEEAFGKKADPVKYGILPVLLVVENAGAAPISLENLKVRYVDRNGDGLDPVHPRDLGLWNPKGNQPKDRPRIIPPIPGMSRPKVKKGPLAKREITESGFDAPLLTPGQSADGFFYYDVRDIERAMSSARIYIDGMVNMTTDQPLFYFEVPLR